MTKEKCVDSIRRQPSLVRRVIWGQTYSGLLPRWHSGKESTSQCRRCWFDPSVRKIPSSVLAWRIPWTEELDGLLRSRGLQWIEHNWVCQTHPFFHSTNIYGTCPMHWACSIYFLEEDDKEKAKATHSNTLAWKIPRMEEPGRLQSMGSWGVRHNRATWLSLFTFMHWRRKWQPTPVCLPGESQGRGGLVGCRLWGRTELDTTEVT